MIVGKLPRFWFCLKRRPLRLLLDYSTLPSPSPYRLASFSTHTEIGRCYPRAFSFVVLCGLPSQRHGYLREGEIEDRGRVETIAGRIIFVACPAVFGSKYPLYSFVHLCQCVTRDESRGQDLLLERP